MIRKILCWLGLRHDWHYSYNNVRSCWYCERKQAVYDGDKNYDNKK